MKGLRIDTFGEIPREQIGIALHQLSVVLDEFSDRSWTNRIENFTIEWSEDFENDIEANQRLLVTIIRDDRRRTYVATEEPNSPVVHVSRCRACKFYNYDNNLDADMHCPQCRIANSGNDDDTDDYADTVQSEWIRQCAPR